MRTNRFALILGLGLVVSLPVTPRSESGGSYELFTSVDGGGELSSGGSYVLGGSIGQADDGPVMSGGTYSLQGGVVQDGSFLPVPVELNTFSIE